MTSTAVKHTFKKEERLSSRKIISSLFEHGKNIAVFPVRLVWMETPLNVVFPAQAAFSVPVKIFRRATDRNRIKRQMKEVYRMHKSALYDFLKKESKQCALMIVFTGKSKPEFEELKKKITVTLQRFEEDFKKHIS